uniref:Uncharacterized protein n=1 Tax=Cacopsylla melanoneura TaxID=428564 RepID=A0A8D8M984_9HEMI
MTVMWRKRLKFGRNYSKNTIRLRRTSIQLPSTTTIWKNSKRLYLTSATTLISWKPTNVSIATRRRTRTTSCETRSGRVKRSESCALLLRKKKKRKRRNEVSCI